MNAIHRKLGLMLSGALVMVSVWACTATRGADGTITLKFAPDMTITARGLEDTLAQLGKLLDKCITGSFSRPCTPTEMSEINKAIKEVASKKIPTRDGFLQPGFIF